MVCIAAFIILSIIGVFVAFVSIFKRDFGKKYLKMFKKAWGCVGKKVRLQKCETGFKEDVKNTILSKVIIKHPNWVKPLSIIMEVISVLIVAITVWALATAIKSLLALWALGTCNVTTPEACSLNPEIGCSINKEEPHNIFEATGRWFTEWGDIFAAIPDKFRDWNPEQFEFETIRIEESNESGALAIDILDPGCIHCKSSYQNQQKGFNESHNIKVVLYAIKDEKGEARFKNSETIIKFITAAQNVDNKLASELIKDIFTKQDENKAWYQNKFNEDFDKNQTIETLSAWVKEAGYDEDVVKKIKDSMDSEEVQNKINKNRDIVENNVHAKSIPTMLYDGGKHTGLFKIDQ